MNDKPDLEKHLITGAAIIMLFVVVVAVAAAVGYVLFDQPLVSSPMQRNIVTNL